MRRNSFIFLSFVFLLPFVFPGCSESGTTLGGQDVGSEIIDGHDVLIEKDSLAADGSTDLGDNGVDATPATA